MLQTKTGGNMPTDPKSTQDTVSQLAPISLAALELIQKSRTGLRASDIGYSLIAAGRITPSRTRVKPQGAAMMVLKYLSQLTKAGLIRHEFHDDVYVGYVATTMGARLNQQS